VALRPTMSIQVNISKTMKPFFNLGVVIDVSNAILREHMCVFPVHLRKLFMVGLDSDLGCLIVFCAEGLLFSRHVSAGPVILITCKVYSSPVLARFGNLESV
jgi:hypothetical protein